jgi:immune inhibitor A
MGDHDNSFGHRHKPVRQFVWLGLHRRTNDWIEEKVDLSEYAGKNIFVRFEYITDAAVNGEGFLLDDVAVEAAGYRSDFEADDGGWQAEGFVRVQNVLPQTFGLALILTSDSSVTMIPLNEDQTAEISFSLSSGERHILWSPAQRVSHASLPPIKSRFDRS